MVIHTLAYRAGTLPVVALMIALGLVGCGDTTATNTGIESSTAPQPPSSHQDEDEEATPDAIAGLPTSEPAPTGGLATSSGPSSGSMPLVLEVDGFTVSAHLDRTAASASLIDQLPLTLPVSDFGGQEKVADLPQPLDLEGAPSGSGAEPGMIGYYVPDQRLILYYDQVGYYAGIIRLGSFDDIPAIEGLPDGVALTLRRDE